MDNDTHTPLIMRKSDFMISPYSECVLREGKHLPVTVEQAKFVYANPSVNGPKVCLFYATTVGMSRDVADAAFMDLLRKAQEDKDNGAEQFVPASAAKSAEASKTEAAADVGGAGDEASEKAGEDEAKKSEAMETLRAFLVDLKTREAVLAYAKTTLSVTVDVHHKAGFERVVQAVLDAVLAKSEKTA